MTKEEYIDKKRRNIQSSFAQKADKYSGREALCIMTFLVAGLGSIAAMSYSTEIALALVSTGAIALSYRYKLQKEYNNYLDKHMAEIKHLRKLDTEEIDKISKAKKLDKAIDLGKLSIKKERKYDDASLLTNITYVVAALGVVATAINADGLWISAIGIVSGLFAINYESKTQREKLVLEEKLNRIVRELDIDKIEDREKTKSKVLDEEKKIEKETTKEETEKLEMEIPEYYYEGFDKPEKKEKPKTYSKDKRD